MNCGKFWKRWEYQTTWPGSWQICMQVRKHIRTGHGTTDWFQIGKGVHQGCILSPCLFNLYAEYIMRNAGLDEAHAGIKIAGRNINNLRYADDTTLMAESKEQPLKESERGEWKSWLKAQKIMASGPITSWQIDGETKETVRGFIFLGSKITADGDCSHETKRRLLLGRKVMTNLDSIFKSRDITLPTKVCLVKAMVFPVVLYRCESWTVKKAAAAAAKLLQSCPTLCDPIGGSPPGSAVPGILQARTLECVAISFSNAWKLKVKVKSLSRVWLSVIPWTAAYQAPPSMEFSRQEYWSGVPLPECLTNDAFELWSWRRLLWVPRTARRSNQPILEEISP